MLGSRATGQLAGNGSAAGHALSHARLSGRRPAIENRLAALQSGSGSWCGWRNNGRLVDRPGPGLRHYHAAWSGRNWRAALLDALRCSCCGFGGDSGNRAWRFACENRGFRFRQRGGGRLKDGDGRWLLNGSGSHRCRRLGGDLFFMRDRSRGRLNRDSSRRRRDHDHWPRSGHSACGSFRNDCARRRASRDGRRGRRRGNDRRRGARLGNDPARFRADRSRGSRRCCSRGLGGCRRLGRRRRCWLHRQTGVARLFFFFLLFGQDGLHHVAGLGDVRQIDLGDDGWLAVARRRSAGMRGMARFLDKMRTHLFCFLRLQRAGVRLASSHAKFRKNVENRARLNFQLFREIVDTNLTHPPLFNSCRQKAF